jgi:single-strand DNA-binding protein
MINRVILIGNLGRDPEMKYSASGTAVCSFSVATSEKWKDKNTGEMQEKTEWSNITAFGRLAEICGEYLSKGSLVYLEGKLQTDKYEKDGQTHYSTKIIAREMKMLGGKSERKTAEPKTPEYNGPPPAEDSDIPF